MGQAAHIASHIVRLAMLLKFMPGATRELTRTLAIESIYLLFLSPLPLHCPGGQLASNYMLFRPTAIEKEGVLIMNSKPKKQKL